MELLTMGSLNDFTIALPTIINMVFMFAFGACAGSFIHVVAYRMPEGLSVISPPSRCPVCGFRLPWYQNMPIVGYLFLRGKCSACSVRIPVRYVLSELWLGLLFVAIYAVLFLPSPADFWYSVGEGWWRSQGAIVAFPALVAVLWGTGALVAMTMCDARTFLIPIAVPAWASVVALIAWPVAAFVADDNGHPFPIPTPSWPLCGATIGAVGGLAIARILLFAGILPRSFDDWGDFAESEGDVFADYPFARREMIKEVAFVGPPLLLGAVGWIVANQLEAPAEMHPALGAFFAVAAGFVIGGAVVWALRIIATVLLDTEALGLGDVHLMSCVGAVFGWRVALIGFVVAPFVGLAWWLGNLFRKAPLRMPFGPSLAVGSFAAFFLKPVIATAVFAGLASMARMGGWARNDPGGALAVAAVLAVAATVSAWAARRTGGIAAAASILLMVGAVVAWILAASIRPTGGAVVAVVLTVGCVVGSAVSGARFEEQPGPRTALSRILRLLAFVVVLVGAVLLLARPGSSS
jgi:leader peptidase (prepilin peptidase)/N-methyltransferase